MTRIEDEDPRPEHDWGYDVGHSKPPKEHQFKKGQSGNPRGRRKGSSSRKKIVHDVANEVNAVMVDGKRSHYTTLELVLMMLRNKAMKGDVRSTGIVEDLLDRYSSRASDMAGGYLVVPEDLSSDEIVAQAREDNAQLDRDIEASGAESFIEYLDMKSKGVNSMA